MAPSIARIPIVAKSFRPNGLRSYAGLLNKYHITPKTPGVFHRHTPHSQLLKTAEDGSSAPVGADDSEDAFWTVPVTIGGQKIDLDFDSGSSDLWVCSSKLDQKSLALLKQNKVAVFDPDQSKTFKDAAGYSWKIQYGDGSSASGSVGFDSVTIGDITVENQGVELASQVSEQFTQSGMSGLLGLAFGSINTVKPKAVKTPVENMILQHDIDSAIWSVYLGSLKDMKDPDQGKSFFTFGGYDKSVVEASGQDISWTTVDSSGGFWQFETGPYLLGGDKVGLSSGQAIADTGTTLMMVSSEVCKALYDPNIFPGAQYVDSLGGYVIPADNVTSRPKLQVPVGNKYFTIEQEQLGWMPLTDNNGKDTGYVFGAIQDRGDLPFDIWGGTFLMCVYALFDVGKKRFGCVQRSDPTPAGDESSKHSTI